jgi:hypothetical protein
MNFLDDYAIRQVIDGRSGEVNLPKLHSWLIKAFVDEYYP